MPLYMHVNAACTTWFGCWEEDYVTHCFGQSVRWNRVRQRLVVMCISRSGKLSRADLAQKISGFKCGFRDGDPRNLNRENLVPVKPGPRLRGPSVVH